MDLLIGRVLLVVPRDTSCRCHDVYTPHGRRCLPCIVLPHTRASTYRPCGITGATGDPPPVSRRNGGCMWSGDTPEACRIGGPSYACKEKKKKPIKLRYESAWACSEPRTAPRTAQPRGRSLSCRQDGARRHKHAERSSLRSEFKDRRRRCDVLTHCARALLCDPTTTRVLGLQ